VRPASGVWAQFLDEVVRASSNPYIVRALVKSLFVEAILTEEEKWA
jgi:hypothetical protein